jgi:hypothetical protein
MTDKEDKKISNIILFAGIMIALYSLNFYAVSSPVFEKQKWNITTTECTNRTIYPETICNKTYFQDRIETKCYHLTNFTSDLPQKETCIIKKVDELELGYGNIFYLGDTEAINYFFKTECKCLIRDTRVSDEEWARCMDYNFEDLVVASYLCEFKCSKYLCKNKFEVTRL